MLNTLKRYGSVELPAIQEFVPLFGFGRSDGTCDYTLECAPTERHEPVVYVHIDPMLSERWRGTVERDIPSRKLHVDTVVRHLDPREIVKRLKLNMPSGLIHAAHVHVLLRQQPRGERSHGDTSRLLITTRRLGNCFVHRVHNGTPMAIRLRYYDKVAAAAAGERVDQMAFPKSGWVVDEISVDNPMFAHPGGRIGYYDPA